jgi:hypothetical protein
VTAIPTLHLNGSAYATLRDGYMAAIEALQTAGTALADTAPNQRDFYVQAVPTFTQAVEQHVRRYREIERMVQELTEIVVALDNQHEAGQGR